MSERPRQNAGGWASVTGATVTPAGRHRGRGAGQFRTGPRGESGWRAGARQRTGRRRRHPDVATVPRLDRRRRPGIPFGRDPYHVVRRAAAAGQRGARRRRVQHSGGGRRSRRGRGDRIVVGVWSGRGVPDHRAAPPVRQRHVLRVRPEYSTRACCTAFMPCTGWTTSPCATSTCTARRWTFMVYPPRC
jgi:hypothetical protein